MKSGCFLHLRLCNTDHNFLWWSATLSYVEYSITVLLMIMCIAVQVGILQLFMLLGIVFLTWATMLLGLLTHFEYEVWLFLASETQQIPYSYQGGETLAPYPYQGGGGDTFVWICTFLMMNKWLVVLLHIMGWVTCIVVYYPILHAYQLVKDNSPNGPPSFVDYIVNAQFRLFICFCFVQLY